MWAARGRGNHIVTTRIEHPAVTEVCRWLAFLTVDQCGMVSTGPSPRSRLRRGRRARRCTPTRRNRQARSRWMWSNWASICCLWRGTSYMRPRVSERRMYAGGCNWRSWSTEPVRNPRSWGWARLARSPTANWLATRRICARCATGWKLGWARGTLRFSAGRMNTHEDIDQAVDAVARAVADY